MASELETQEAYILAQLGRGIAFRTIARELTRMGCKTSHQNLSQWVARRANRIRNRAGRIDPLGLGALPSPVASTSSLPSTTTDQPAATVPRVIGDSKVGARRQPSASSQMLASLIPVPGGEFDLG